MKKYIITERQNLMLKEMMIPSGKYETKPLGDFFRLFNNPTTEFSDVSKIVRKYLENIVGIDTSTISNEKLYEYVFELRYSDKVKGLPKALYNIGVVSGLTYHLAKKLFKLKKTPYGLSYFIHTQDSHHDYWFFDAEIRDFIGRIQVQDNHDYTSPSYTVVVSSLDPVFIGRGYGSRMYLTVLDNCEYLKSDTLLYKDSLNIWVNFLPKYVNVWASVKGEGFVKINKNFIKPDDINYFVASKKHNEI